MKYLLFIFLLLTLQDNSYQLLWDADDPPDWSDFRAVPSTSSPHSAATHYLINSYINYGEGTNIEYEVKCLFLRDKSWVKRDARNDQNLLDHELLHFDIAECRARVLRKSLNERVKIEDAVPRLKHLKDSIAAEWRKVQERYDLETEHGTISESQMKWEVRVDSIMLSLEDFAEPAFEVVPLH